MRILVCGGRDYNNKEVIREKLTDLKRRYPDAMLVHGGAPGADAMAGWIGGTVGFEVEVNTAQWAQYGKAAGPMRNQEMLDSGIDLVVAFPGGRGTADMVDRARLAGVAIESVEGDSGNYHPDATDVDSKPFESGKTGENITQRKGCIPGRERCDNHES